jgi:hypothetical protein
MHPLKSIAFSLILIGLCHGGAAIAEIACATSLNKGAIAQMIHHPEYKYLLVEQRESVLKSARTACGNVCGANILQALRVAAGLKPVPRLNEVVEARMLDPRFANGLDANDEKAWIEALNAEVLPEQRLQVHAKQLLDSAETPGATHVLNGTDLKLNAKTAQAILVLPLDSEGRSTSTPHWMLISEIHWGKSEFVLSDPTTLGEDIVAEGNSFSQDGAESIWFSLQTPHADGTDRYVLLGIVTAELPSIH